MGLNIIARIRSNSELEIENTYKLENWHKVETGEITETEYNNNFPNFKPRWKNVMKLLVSVEKL